MKRAAIYARFSSDRQRDRSIDDQIALCREFAERNRWTVMAVYADRRISGATMHRPQFARLLEAAGKHEFDVLIAEDIDRLARGEGDAPKLREHMDFLGIEIHTCSDGLITKVQAGLKGLLSSLFPENLGAPPRRGMAGVIRDGRHAGGRAYGYRAVPGSPGKLEIVSAEAKIIARIYREFIAGDTARTIATR